MMVMNVVFLKLILSAMSVMPTGVMVLPWGILVVGLARAARKIDSMIGKIGLNPAVPGDPLTRGGIGMATMMAARLARQTISSVPNRVKAIRSGGQNRALSSGNGERSTPRRAHTAAGGTGQPNTDRFGMANQAANMQNQPNSRFGSTSYVQGGTLHAPQNTAVQSISEVPAVQISTALVSIQSTPAGRLISRFRRPVKVFRQYRAVSIHLPDSK